MCCGKIYHLSPRKTETIPRVRSINCTNPVIMRAWILLLPRCHSFHIFKLKHPLLQKRSHDNPAQCHRKVHTTAQQNSPPKNEHRVTNSYHWDALGEEELLKREPHELAVDEEVEGLRLVIRGGCPIRRKRVREIPRSIRGDAGG